MYSFSALIFLGAACLCAAKPTSRSGLPKADVATTESLAGRLSASLQQGAIADISNGFLRYSPLFEQLTATSSNKFQVTSTEIVPIQNRPYLQWRVLTADGERVTAFSELIKVGTKVFLPRPDLNLVRWLCWQVAECQCVRPERASQCTCNGFGGSDGCTLAQDRWDLWGELSTLPVLG